MNKVVNYIKSLAFFGINGTRKIVYLLCLAFPIKKKRIFVNAFDGKGISDNPKYIVKELIKMDSSVDIIWINKRKNDIPPDNITYCVPFSLKAIYYQATSRVWISTVRMPYYSIKRKQQYYFHTWHAGLAFKKVEAECEHALSSRYIRTAKHDSKMVDFFISDNDDNTSLFLNDFWYQGGEILKLGSPRNDIFYFDKEADVNILKAKYHLEKCKVAVYAPTFRSDNCLDVYNMDYERLLSNLEKKFGGEWVLLVRLHPRLEKKAESYIKYTHSIRNGSSITDIQELLVIADFLITDYSSIVFDYINTRRAAIIYAPDIEEYKKDRDFHVKLEDSPFYICTNNDELEGRILDFNYEEYIAGVNEFMKRFGFYGKGDASRKVAQKIESLL